MASRRRSTLERCTRGTASELAQNAPKSIELELRVARLELAIKEICESVAVLTKRTVAVQAQLDHLDARLTRR